MKTQRSVSQTILGLSLTLVFTVVFSTRMFYEPIGGTPGFEQWSERFVTGKISSDLTFWQDWLEKGGFAYQATDQPPYLTATGLQATLFSIPHKLFGLQAEETIRFFRVLISLLLALLLTGYCGVLLTQFGWITVVVVVVYILSSYWIVSFAKNLAYMTFIYFAPLLISWMIYPLVINGKLKRTHFYGIVAIQLFFSSTITYVYLTNTIIGATVPIIVYEVMANDTRPMDIRRLAKIILSTIISGIAGFLAALALHSIQLVWYTGGIEHLTNKIAARTLGDQYPDCESSLIRIGLAFLMKPHWINPLSAILPMPRVVGPFYLQLIAYLIATIVLASRKWLGKFSGLELEQGEKVFYKAKALNLTTAWALLGSLSFLVLGKNMNGCHIHMNSIIFYFPFGVTLAAQVGFLLEIAIKGVRLRRVRIEPGGQPRQE